MMDFCGLKKASKHLFIALLYGLIISCSKQELLPVSSPDEELDIVTGILDYATVDCCITDWFDNYPKSINFTWDDANITHTTIDDIFKKYDYIATYFIQTNAFRQSSYLVEYKKIQERGNEIASHTVNHYYLPEISISQVEKELVESANDICAIYGYFPTTFAHPGSQYNYKIDSLVSKYYLSSRYSSIIDTKDRTFWGFRSKQSGKSIISGLDSFMNDEKKWMIYGGHGVDGIGYEPINTGDLDTLLSYLKERYSKQLWVTTFANSSMYKFLRQNICLKYGSDFVFCDRNPIIGSIQKYSNAECIITLKFPNSKNRFFSSPGIVKQRVQDNDQFISVDIRKSRIINFK